MSANQVIDKILSEAQSQAEQIKKQADEKNAKEKQKFQAELDSYNKETDRLKNKAFEEAKSQTLASARMQIAKNGLKVKKDLLDETFNMAAEKIMNMDAADYQGLMEKLILSAVQSGDEELVVDKNEGRIDAGFVERLNSKLSDKGHLKLSDSRADIGAGFILQKGRVRVNGSLKVLIDTARENLQTELAGELFGQ
jgi:V/A-type H+-transporting ATPase subunit E